MVEYRHSFIPSTLGFVLTNYVFNKTDLYLMYQRLRIYSLDLLYESSLFDDF